MRSENATKTRERYSSRFLNKKKKNFTQRTVVAAHRVCNDIVIVACCCCVVAGTETKVVNITTTTTTTIKKNDFKTKKKKTHTAAGSKNRCVANSSILRISILLFSISDVHGGLNSHPTPGSRTDEKYKLKLKSLSKAIRVSARYVRALQLFTKLQVRAVWEMLFELVQNAHRVSEILSTRKRNTRCIDTSKPLHDSVFVIVLRDLVAL